MGEDQLTIQGADDLLFEWTPAGEDEVQIAMYFSDDATGREWQIECSTDDDGAFHFDAEDFGLMPTATPGVAWFRRLAYTWTEHEDPNPGLWMVGAREIRWTVEIEPEAGDDDDDDPNGG